MIFIASNLLSGIGQVVSKYAQLMNSKMYTYQDEIPENQDVFIFALPIPQVVEYVKNIKKISKTVHCMCVCETETVHPIHRNLFYLFKEIYVPSEFCKNVFSRQFPETNFHVIHHWVPEPPLMITNSNLEIPKYGYTFYHIGNIMDHRKQVKKIVEAFLRLQLPNSHLVLKATCLKNVEWKIPNVTIINGLLPDCEIQKIHKMCDCYVSFSYSEGVGMGAVEAALNNKPVIIPEYGGCAEYIQTPYLIKCGRKQVGVDDFLYMKDMEWGDPDFSQLQEFMKKVYEKKLSYMDHTHTKNLMLNIKNEFKTFLH